MLILNPDNEVVLRILTEVDAEHVFRVVDENRSRLKEWLGWLDNQASVNDSSGFILAGQKGYEEKKLFRFGIFFAGEFAGVIELQSIDYTNKKSSLGYWLADNFIGKGIMTKSVRTVLEYAFTELDLNRVELRAATGNLPSNKIAEKVGFTKEGVLRQNEWLYDHFVDQNVYSILQAEWKQLAK